MAIFLKKAANEPGPQHIETEIQGIPIVIEYPKDSVRTGINAEGEEWETVQQADYGYIVETKTKEDGEDLDIYVGLNWEAPNAYIVEQLDDEGKRDEFKALLGFDTQNQALSVYKSNYPDGWEDHIGDVWTVPVRCIRDLLEIRAGDE